METLLISLHPRHSKKVFSGEKTIELRKRPVRKDNKMRLTFDHILIYETLPTAAIVGYCKTTCRVFYKNAQDYCNNHQKRLCLTSREIWEYLGDRMGYGIEIKNPQRITPIPLSKMRELKILPPQGFRYLSDTDLEKLGVKFFND